MKFKKSIFAIATTALILSLTTQVQASSSVEPTDKSAKCDNIRLQIGNKKNVINNTYAKDLDVAPLVKNGNTLVPLRYVSETLKAKVEWNAKTSEINIKQNDQNIQLKIGSKTAYVNGKAKVLDISPEETKGTTLVPLRFVSENLNASVTWQKDNQIIDILSNFCVSTKRLDVDTFKAKLAEKLDKEKYLDLLYSDLSEEQLNLLYNRQLSADEVKNLGDSKWREDEYDQAISKLSLTDEERKYTKVSEFKINLEMMEAYSEILNPLSTRINYSVLKTNNALDLSKIKQSIDKYGTLETDPSFDSNSNLSHVKIKLSLQNGKYIGLTSNGEVIADSLANELGANYLDKTTTSTEIKAYPIDVSILYEGGFLVNFNLAYPNNVRDLNGHGLLYQDETSKNLNNLLFPNEIDKPGSFILTDNGRVFYTGTDAYIDKNYIVHSSDSNMNKTKKDFSFEREKTYLNSKLYKSLTENLK